MAALYTTIKEHLRKALCSVGIVIRRSPTSLLSGDPVIHSGDDAPTDADGNANGSIHMRTNGTISFKSGDVYVAATSTVASVGDDTTFWWGAGNDFGIEYDENGTDDARIVQGASDPDLVFPDDMLLMFGTDKDVWLEYDEDGGDTGILGGVNGWLFPDDAPLYFGADKDIKFEYDEDGTDDLRITNGASDADIVIEDTLLVCFGDDKDSSIGNDGSTGLQVLIADNDADSFEIAQGANVYFHCDTTNDKERVVASKILTMPSVTTVDMADAAHALVLGTAGAGETKLLGNIVFCDPNSTGASEILTLVPEADADGMWLILINTGGEGIVVKDDAAATIVTLDTAQHAILACDGVTWYGFIGGVT